MLLLRAGATTYEESTNWRQMQQEKYSHEKNR